MDYLYLLITFQLLLYSYTGSATYPSDGFNPCSGSALTAGRMYHAYPGEPTMYIQCDAWGQAHPRHCPPGQSWHSAHYTCIKAAQAHHQHTQTHASTHRQPTAHKSQPNLQQYTYEAAPQPNHYKSQQPMQQYKSQPPMQQYKSQPPMQQYKSQPPRHQVQYQSHMPAVKQSQSHEYNNYMVSKSNSNVHSGMLNYIIVASQEKDHSNHDAKSFTVMHTENGDTSYALPAQVMANVMSSNNVGTHYILGESHNKGQKSINMASHSMDTEIDVIHKNLDCSKKHVRYQSDSGDIHHYYECMEGVPTHQFCPSKQVWVQPLRECVDLNQPQQPVNQHNHNPCIGNDDRYHPYPGNSSMYLECQTWYRVYVWSCAHSQIWSQQTQSCQDLEKMEVYRPIYLVPVEVQQPKPLPQPVKPRPTRRPTPKPHHHGNPCFDTSTSFYHPYPRDSTRYIQCDQFGNMYLRKCGSRKIWSDHYKTCVGRVNATSTSQERFPGRVIPGDMTEEEYRAYYMAAASAAAGQGQANSRQGSSQATSNQGTAPRASVRFGSGSDDMATELIRQTLQSGNRDLVFSADGTGGLVASRRSGRSVKKDSSDNSMYDYYYLDVDDSSLPNCGENNRWEPRLQMCITDLDIKRVPVSQEGYDYDASQGIDDANMILPVAGLYEGYNPCGKGGNQYYFTFPNDPFYFIQCDQMGEMHIQPCDEGQAWSQSIMTCVSNIYFQATSGSDDTGAGQDGGAGQDYEPCKTDDEEIQTFVAHPSDKHQFIMCVHEIPYPMFCPNGSMWSPTIETCTWPVDYTALEEEEDTEIGFAADLAAIRGSSIIRPQEMENSDAVRNNLIAETLNSANARDFPQPI